MKTMMANLGRQAIQFKDTKNIIKQLIGLGLIQEKPRQIMKKETSAKEKSASNFNYYANVSDSQLFLRVTVDDLTNSLKNDTFLSKFLDTM